MDIANSLNFGNVPGWLIIIAIFAFYWFFIRKKNK